MFVGHCVYYAFVYPILAHQIVETAPHSSFLKPDKLDHVPAEYPYRDRQRIPLINSHESPGGRRLDAITAFALIEKFISYSDIAPSIGVTDDRNLKPGKFGLRSSSILILSHNLGGY